MPFHACVARASAEIWALRGVFPGALTSRALGGSSDHDPVSVMNVLYGSKLSLQWWRQLPQLVVYADGFAGRGMMHWPRCLAALFVVLALAGCASVAAGPRQAPNAPYQQGDP